MKTSLFSCGNNCIICHTRRAIMGQRGWKCANSVFVFLQISRWLTWESASSRLSARQLRGPGLLGAVSGSSQFTKSWVWALDSGPTEMKSLDLLLHFLFFIFYFFLSSPGLSDINFSWLTVNQIALWAQFSFWFSSSRTADSEHQDKVPLWVKVMHIQWLKSSH